MGEDYLFGIGLSPAFTETVTVVITNNTKGGAWERTQ